MAHNHMRFMVAAIALAEELNFSRAAKKVGVSQPSLTRTIYELEAYVGGPLFERNRKTVRVNDAGRAFVEEARMAIFHEERAFQSARAVMHDAEVVLNVGRSPYTDPFFTTTLLSLRLPLFPKLRIELSQQFSYDLAHEVLSGGLDLAIVTEPPESRRLTTVKIAEAPFYIAMEEDDELAYEDSVTLDMLAGRPWVIFERRMHPPVYDAVMRLAQKRMIVPSKIHHIVVPEDAYPFIADDDAVAFVVKSGAIRIARDDITVRPLDESSLLLKTYLASRAEEKSKVVSELVRSFMRKLSTFTKVAPFSLPVSDVKPMPLLQ
jgi:DNA-binding transcriptional LysR family regulator